jgi:hypothetical protein
MNLLEGFLNALSFCFFLLKALFRIEEKTIRYA